jgi:hypothetical protein
MRLGIERVRAVDPMFGIELAQARVDRDATAEGEVSLAIELLTRKLGDVTPQLLDRVNNLQLDRVESLGEALLDFTSIAELENWLSQN